MAAAGFIVGAMVLPALAEDAAVRFATFNAALNSDSAGQLLADLANPGGGSLADAMGRRSGVAATYAGFTNSTHASSTLASAVSAMPEPGSALQLLAGLGAVGLLASRRR